MMGSPVPAILVGPVFHDGFPSYTMSGPTSYMLYEAKLSDGSVVEAYVRGEMIEEIWTHRWYRASDDTPVGDGVIGWRDQTSCADYALAIAHWAWEPFGVVKKSDWAVALSRHIAAKGGDGDLASRVTCESCARKYVQACVAKRGQVPEGWEAFA